MTTAKKAEEYVKNYFKTTYGIDLIKSKGSDRGFDFRDQKSKIYIEVKGTEEKKLSGIPFRYFTNTQYEKAKECIRNKKKYEIHLIIGIGTNNIEHYCIPATVLIEKAKPEITWSLPIRKEINEFKIG